MKILVLDGFKAEDDYCDNLYENIEKAFGNLSEVQRIKLNEKNIKPCIGCFGCWIKKPGQCVIEDDAQQIAKMIINSDVLVYFTPVTFGGYSWQLKKILDRTIGLVLPFFTKINGEMHHKKRYDKYPTIIGVGVMDEYDKEQGDNFKALVHRNSLNFYSTHEGAEIILKSDSLEEANKKISVLLNSIEVNS